MAARMKLCDYCGQITPFPRYGNKKDCQEITKQTMRQMSDRILSEIEYRQPTVQEASDA